MAGTTSSQKPLRESDLAGWSLLERILALQAKKRGLIEATVEDDATVMTGLTETDLEDLLAD